MLDFSAARGITADVETIPVQDIDRVYQRMLRGDVRYRFVIDAASLKGTGFRPAWIRPEVGMCSPPRSDC